MPKRLTDEEKEQRAKEQAARITQKELEKHNRRVQKTEQAKKQKPEENTLLSALKFVALVQPKRSSVASFTHCRMFGSRLSAMGPVLSASVGIQEEIECCPDTQKFMEALKQCPETVNLTLMPTKELSIKSGNFQATVPCIDQGNIPVIAADPAQLDVEVYFQQALETVGEISDEHSKLILYSSVVLINESVIATNGEVIMQYWHGGTTPENLIVPKLFISALRRTKGKTFYRLGWSLDSLTAYFPDGAWLKTRLPVDPDIPRLQGFLTLPCSPTPVPLGLWAAVDRLAPFSTDGKIYFTERGVCTTKYETDGAINLCEGLPPGLSFPISALQLIAPHAETLAFNVTDKITYFFGKNIRGAITQTLDK